MGGGRLGGNHNLLKTDKGKRKMLPYLLCYTLWVITAALGFLDLIAARSLCLTLMGVASLSRWVAPAVDKFIFLVFGIVWLILVIFSEYYYRNSIPKKRLWQSFSLIAGIELSFLSLSHLFPFLILGLGKLSWFNLLVIGTECAGGTVLLLFAFHSSHRRKISGAKS